MLKAQDFPQVLYSPDLPEKQMPYDDWAWLLDGFGHPLDTLYHGARLDFHMFVRRCSSTQSSTPTKTSPPRSPDKTSASQIAYYTVAPAPITGLSSA